MNHSILFIARRDLEVNKRRYRLVRLSIAISVLLIVLVMLISNSFYNKMIKEMTVANKNVVTVAFGVRNFEHLELGLREMQRVLRPG